MSLILPGCDLEALAERLISTEQYEFVSVAEDQSHVFALRRTLSGFEIIGDCDEFGCSQVWSYTFFTTAVLAFFGWSGNSGTEPVGWIRHMPSGRRRPHGDPALEEVRP